MNDMFSPILHSFVVHRLNVRKVGTIESKKVV
jgi:hypothetical protein